MALPIAASPGSAQDPVVQKSYIDNVFIPKVAEKAVSPITKSYSEAVDELAMYTLALQSNAAMYPPREVSRRIVLKAPNFQKITLSISQTLRGGEGTQVLLETGSVHTEGKWVNFTNGTQLPSQDVVPLGTLIGCIESNSLTARSKATLWVRGNYSLILPAPVRHEAHAQALKEMGLIAGSDVGLELERSGTRVEGIAVMVSFLGQLNTAQAQGTLSPFTDVPDWAKYTVGFAYSSGYTAGTSATSFSPRTTLSANMFTTYLLIALGYQTGVDFQWDHSLSYAASIGLITQVDEQRITDSFARDEVFFLAYRALQTNIKGTGTTLLSRLISQGVVDADVARIAMAKVPS
jgi:hypothetical protein